MTECTDCGWFYLDAMNIVVISSKYTTVPYYELMRPKEAEEKQI